MILAVMKVSAILLFEGESPLDHGASNANSQIDYMNQQLND